MIDPMGAVKNNLDAYCQSTFVTLKLIKDRQDYQRLWAPKLTVFPVPRESHDSR